MLSGPGTRTEGVADGGPFDLSAGTRWSVQE